MTLGLTNLTFALLILPLVDAVNLGDADQDAGEAAEAAGEVLALPILLSLVSMHGA